MKTRREYQCRRGLKPITFALAAAALSMVTARGQNATPPPGAAPAAQGQTIGTPPSEATQTPAAGRLPGSAVDIPPTSQDRVVMRVGNQQLTEREMDAIVRNLPQAFQRAVGTQGMKVVGDQFSVLLALAQKAKSDGLDRTPEFRQRVELQRLQWLAQDEYQKMASEAKVSPEEVSQFYQQNQPQFEQVEIRQVSVRKKPAGGDANAPGLPEAEAKARAEVIRQALASGQDAAAVAEQYNMPDVVFLDPTPHPIHRGQLPGEMDQIAWTLKDGEVSKIQDNPTNYYFIQVVKHEHQELKDVSSGIEGRIRRQAFEKQLETLKQQANIWLDPEYFGPPKPPAPESRPAASAASPETPGNKPQ